jgi:serine protease Do
MATQMTQIDELSGERGNRPIAPGFARGPSQNRTRMMRRFFNSFYSGFQLFSPRAKPGANGRLACCLAVSLASGSIGLAHARGDDSQAARGMAPVSVPPAPAENLRLTNTVRIYQMDKDAVVNISSTRMINAPVGGSGDEMFDRFFQPMMVRRVPAQSLGSGFVIHASGYIITNEHVIDQASEVNVTFVDGRSLPAQVLATDSDHDLAVLKVTPEANAPLHAIALGSSDDLMIGEPVYAIGNPFGYASSMTSGIVSATQRDLQITENHTYKGLIQTDASINPGNSGGPLINAYGQVIGLNTAIRAEAHGIGFAIGVSKLRDLLPNLLNSEALRRTEMGFTLGEQRTLTQPATIESRCVIKSVAPNSPAQKAGLVAGDQLIELNGVPVATVIDPLVTLLSAKTGDMLSMKIARGGMAYTVSLAVTKAPPPESERILASRLGLSGISVTPSVAREHDLPIESGLLVTSVAADSPVARAGIQTGDVIYQVGPYIVNSLDDVAQLIKSADPDLRVRIGLIRGTARGRTIVTIH